MWNCVKLCQIGFLLMNVKFGNGILLPKLLRSLEQFIQTVKGQNNFWQQNAFLTCSWRFLISNKLEQLEFKLEKKNIGI